MNSHGNVTLPAARDTVTLPVLERLPHHFERRASEFRKFIEKKHAVMRETNFARRRIGRAA